MSYTSIKLNANISSQLDKKIFFWNATECFSEAFVTRVKKSYNSKESLKNVFRKDAILCFSRVGYQGVDALYDAILQSPQTKKKQNILWLN